MKKKQLKILLEMVEIDVVSSLLVFMVWFGSLEHTGVHTVGQADAGGDGGGVL